MKTRRRGKRIAITTGLCVLLIGLAVIVWYREQIQVSCVLWVNFERLPNNNRGCAEYRHRATGMLFVRSPGMSTYVGPYEPPKVEISPFLIAKRKVTRSDWQKVLGSFLPEERITSLENRKAFCAKVGLEIPTRRQLNCASFVLELGWHRPSGFHPVFNLPAISISCEEPKH